MDFYLTSPNSGEDPVDAPDLLMEISTILNTGLDRHTLGILLNLLKQGIHPEALARVVLELDQELLKVKDKEERAASAALCRGREAA